MSHNAEPTRVRDGGTFVTASDGDASVKIAAIRQIVDRKQYAKVDGVMIDLFSASAIVQVYDAISIPAKMKFATMSVSQMAIVAFRVIKKAEGR